MVCRVQQHSPVLPAVDPSLDGCNDILKSLLETREQDATIRYGLVASCSRRTVSNFGALGALPRQAKVGIRGCAKFGGEARVNRFFSSTVAASLHQMNRCD